MTKLTWTSEKVMIGELYDYEDNPRVIKEQDFKDLVKSIKTDGYHEILLVDTDNTIISGNNRKRALLNAGYKVSDLIDVRKPNRKLTKEEFQRINIQANTHHGKFDFEILANTFDVDKLIEWKVELPKIDFKPLKEKTDELNECCPECKRPLKRAKNG